MVISDGYSSVEKDLTCIAFGQWCVAVKIRIEKPFGLRCREISQFCHSLPDNTACLTGEQYDIPLAIASM